MSSNQFDSKSILRKKGGIEAKMVEMKMDLDMIFALNFIILAFHFLSLKKVLLFFIENIDFTLYYLLSFF